MMPVLRRTWALCGATPTLSVRARSHEKVSGIGALVVSPRRRHITLALALHPRMNIRGPQVLRFLRHLARHVRGSVILLWDRGRSHRHHLVRAWLAAHPRFHIVWFPPYAPELNPVELLWGYLNLPRFGRHPRSHESAVGVCHGQTQAAGVHEGVQGAGRSHRAGERESNQRGGAGT